MEKEYIKVNKNAYNIFAPQHANRHDKIGKYDLTDGDWTELLKEKLLKKNISNKVLEIGPGTGRILKILEPTAFPTAISTSFFLAATTEVTKYFFYRR
mgnify:CR=1 FL=1